MTVKLIDEGVNFKVDSSGRTVIPVHMRAKYGIKAGDMMNYYTATGPNGEVFICMTKTKPEADNEEDI